MMIIKSFALGLAIFVVGTIGYLMFRLRGLTPLPPGQSRVIGLSVLQVYTIYNVWYWVALAVSLAVGYWIVRRLSAGA